MRYVFKILAVFCVIALFGIMVFQNTPDLVHNIFYKTKRRICWDPMDKYRHLDDTERFYHE